MELSQREMLVRLNSDNAQKWDFLKTLNLIGLIPVAARLLVFTATMVAGFHSYHGYLAAGFQGYCRAGEKNGNGQVKSSQSLVFSCRFYSCSWFNNFWIVASLWSLSRELKNDFDYFVTVLIAFMEGQFWERPYSTLPEVLPLNDV